MRSSDHAAHPASLHYPRPIFLISQTLPLPSIALSRTDPILFPPEATDLLLDYLSAAPLNYAVPYLTQNLTGEHAALATDDVILGAAAGGWLVNSG